jgi:Carboxypeptidase regulatory-like domain
MAKTWIIALAACFCGLAQSQSGSVQGVVRDEGGKAVRNVRVIAAPQPAGAGVQTQTDGQGVFNLTGVAAGTYLLCVQDPANQHLDPCYWSSSPRQVTIAAGQTITNQVVTALSATTLEVQVQDPKGLTDPKSGPNETLIAILRPNGRLLPLSLTGSEPAGKTYAVAVPAAKHALFVKSNLFTISDDQGNPVEASNDGQGHLAPPKIPVSISQGAQNIRVTLTVTGRR